MNAFALEAEGISKFFPGVKALDNVSLRVRPGTVHALMGENGAGKSTLMKCLIGIYRPDKGSIRVKGEPVEFTDTMDALRSGISMIHQELNLVPHMTVAENIWLGREPMKYGFVDHGQLTRQTQALLDKLNIRLTADRLVGDLSIAAQQMVEIAKAVSWNADIVIMDEPTSALTEGEVAHLFTIIRDLRAQGKAIIYISHRMAEVYELSDRVSVLRDGQYVGSLVRDKLNAPELVRMMVGRPLSDLFNKERDIPRGQPRLRVEDLTDGGKIKPSSLVVHAGEIVGLAGLVGSGRTEFAETLYGLRPPRAGRIWLENREISNDSTRARLASGLVYLPEDRQVSGLFLDAPVRWNTVMFNQPSWWQQGKREAAVVERYHRALGIKLADGDQPVRTLSGGNQQKVLLARCLEANPLLLIVDEPTRGVDVSARADIYQLLKSVAAQNVAVLMISSDLDEFIGLADRVLVMHQGRYSGELARQAVTVDRMMTLAFGGQA